MDRGHRVRMLPFMYDKSDPQAGKGIADAKLGCQETFRACYSLSCIYQVQIGILTCTILEVADLKWEALSMGVNNIYCVATIERTKVTTSMKSNTLTPVFNEAFNAYVTRLVFLRILSPPSQGRDGRE